MNLGERVQISVSHDWAQGALGVVKSAPAAIREMSSGWINDFSRIVRTSKGESLCYWILFDSPHFDANNDGPYSEAEIDGRYVEPIPLP